MYSMDQIIAECPGGMTGLNVYGPVDLPASITLLQQAGHSAQILTYSPGFGQLLIASQYDREIAGWLETIPGVRVEMVASGTIHGKKH